jgi:hypothetical protein
MTESLQEWAAATSEKMILALVFTDIVGSTVLLQQDDYEMLDTHFGRARRLISFHHGFEVKTLGDGLMVAFRTTAAAFRFALALNGNTGHKLVRARAGMHVGVIQIKDNDLFGRMIAYTRRVTDWPADDWVVLSNLAKEHVEAEIGIAPLLARFLKITSALEGFRKSQTLWQAMLKDILEVWPFKRIGDKEDGSDEEDGDDKRAQFIRDDERVQLIRDEIVNERSKTLKAIRIEASSNVINNRDYDAPDAEREFDPDYILSGHYYGEGTRIHVYAKLLRVSDNMVMWEKTFEVDR